MQSKYWRHLLITAAKRIISGRVPTIISNFNFEYETDEDEESEEIIEEELELDEVEQQRIYIGGLFHDIGKIGVPDSILLKNAKLTDEEYSEIKNHPSIGKHILSNASLFENLIPIVYHHHEKYDGTGYPKQLKGEEIPLLARIVAVADAFDAMTSKRSYRNELDLEYVKNEIKRCSGTQFDFFRYIK